MRSALIAAAQASAEQIVEAVTVAEAPKVAVAGATGSGRSLALQLASEMLAGQGAAPLLVMPPARHVDTPGLALLDAISGLEAVGVTRASAWTGKATWSEQVSRLRKLLNEGSEVRPYVLLVDDHRRWAIPESKEGASHLADAVDLFVQEAPCISVSAGVLDGSALRVEVRRPSLTEMTSDPDDWGLLADVAEQIGAHAEGLGGRSPADIGFLVALGQLTSIASALNLWRERPSTAQLADELVRVVATAPNLRRLSAAWVQASIARRPVPNEYLGRHQEGLTPVQGDVFRHCLVAANGTRLVREARAAAWRLERTSFVAAAECRATRELYELHSGRFADAVARAAPGSLLYAAEAIHLAGRLDDMDAAQTMPAAFSDQFNAVGIDALERGEPSLAARAFDSAIEIDINDPLAFHYRGLSLDHLAREPRLVEASYRRALDLEPSHAAWHSRLVSLMVVLAKIGAARTDWTAGRDALVPDDGPASPEVYAKLHVPVASNLLRRSELDMASVVLGDIPSLMDRTLPGAVDLKASLAMLEAAQSTGPFVPADRAGDGWWRQGPALLAERHADGRPLGMWVAAGVERVAPDGLGLAVAVVRGDQDPQIGSTLLTWDYVRQHAVDTTRAERVEPGDFLEIGYYFMGSEVSTDDPVVRVLPRTNWFMRITPPLESDRYVRQLLRWRR